jgi:hypothetical protein
MILEADGEFADAGWAAMRAAWACDDNELTSAADACRDRAIALFGQAAENADNFADGAGVEESILADLLRRSRQFDGAAAMCQAGLAENPEPLVVDILNFQLDRARQDDWACYTLADLG